MKRIISIILVLLLLSSCTTQKQNNSVDNTTTIAFDSLSDSSLLTYIEDNTYNDLILNLEDEKYFVDNVDAIYISKEYIEELEYNSKSNLFFGYSLEEIDSCFQGDRYVFALGDDGKTTVESFEKYDETYEKMIKNVAIGTGVIFVCVTVTIVSGGTVGVVFAASAKTATTCALSGSIFSGVTSGIVTGIQTKDFDKSLKSAALSASEGFKWGAITGAVTGFASGLKQVAAFKGSKLQGLKVNEAAKIQNETKWSTETIKQMRSMKEYNVYKTANLKEVKLPNQTLLTKKKLDLNFKSELPDGSIVTNLQRMQKGNAPIEPATGFPYELHHIGQKNNGVLAMLTKYEHSTNASVLNTKGGPSEIDRQAFSKLKKTVYKNLAKFLSEGVE